MPVKFEKLPKYLIDGLISSEDASFWTNPGVDLKAIVRSFFINIKNGRIVTGASTLTQQLARATNFSPQQIQSRSFLRKIREILIALRLTGSYSKKEILKMYLNEMYFGNLSYGIESAADTYFGKTASQLSLSESAFLVGLISAPVQRDPYTNFDNALKAQREVLDLMAKNSFISKEKAKEAKGEQVNIEKKKTNIKAPHFVQYVLEEQKSLSVVSDRGINIYTTLDYPSFVLSQDIARLWVKKLAAKHDLTNAGLVLLKNDSGEILVLLGGIDYFDIKNAGEVSIATSPRQPGSSIKPVTYAAAFMKGETPASLIYDVKKVYKTKKGEGFTPGNYDGQYHGMVLAREALASSLNLPAVEMLNRVGIGNFLKTAKDLGISTFSQGDRYDLSLTLGGGEVKLLDLTNVYASLARGGGYKPYFAIKKIVSDQGQTLYLHTGQKGKQVLGKNGPQVAYLISHILSDPKARIAGFGEKNPLVLSHPAAVKTGTTTDWHDNWTIGFTPNYTVGVWVGNNDNHPMKEITGIVGAAPIWNQFFEEFLKGKPKEQFARPEGLIEREICKSSGKLVDGLCPERARELFIKGTEPKDKSTIHKKIRIDTRNNLLAAGNCPEEFVSQKIFIDYPPEVYT